MLRPHLLLTLLVFIAVGAYFAHVVSVERGRPGAATSGSSTGASAGAGGRSGSGEGGEGGQTKGGFSDKQADNSDWSDRSDDNGSRDGRPGTFDYYALVLSWSPAYCADQGRDNDSQCNRRDGRRYSFVLHGLWPQYEQGYPSNCRLPRRPFVPEPVINDMLDIMPSRGLVIHEYRAHGTCSGLDPADYFSLARRLFQSINVPSRFRNPMESQIVSAADVKREFLRANPQLKSDGVTVVCGGAGGTLREVRLCLSKDGSPRTCGQNETRRNLCSANQVFVPPARSTARDSDSDRPRSTEIPSPAPGSGTGTGRPDFLPGPR
jgi:ribonuclease T2